MAFYLNNENFKASKTNEQNAKRNMADRQQRWFSRTEFRFGLVKKSDMVAHIHVYVLHTIFLIYILATFLRISSSTNGNEKSNDSPQWMPEYLVRDVYLIVQRLAFVLLCDLISF